MIRKKISPVSINYAGTRRKHDQNKLEHSTDYFCAAISGSCQYRIALPSGSRKSKPGKTISKIRQL